MNTDLTNPRILRSEFKPAWWLLNRHAQTIYPSTPWALRHRPTLRRETLELPDGDVTAVDWMIPATELPKSAPLLVILHGLEGSAQSSYAQMLMLGAYQRGWQSCVLNFRDCGDYRNRLPRRYHAGETNDIKYFLHSMKDEGFDGPVMAVGYSLGGNVLLKYLGETGVDTPLRAAAAVSVPFDLDKCSDALNTGFSKGYQRYLLKRMKSAVSRKFDQHTAAFDWSKAMNAVTFAEFDDAVTAPLHGFAGKDDYYDRCSSGQFLNEIQRPTLIIHSLDDPFMTPNVIPREEQIGEHVSLEVSDAGGHVGYINGGTPWRPTYYLPERLLGFLQPFAARTSPAETD
jgi:predicted alpha/beta-fold hydrolase